MNSRPRNQCPAAAAPVQSLRLPPLSLAARESMKVTGASRRSAAPGSQFVGVAGYGDGSCAFQQSSSTRMNRTICAASSIHAPLQIAFHLLRWLALAREQGAPPSHSRAAFPHKTTRLRYRRAAPLPVCAILRPNEASPPQKVRFRHRSICTSRTPMQAPQHKTANPSVKPTHSGLRPPRAAYLKRWAPSIRPSAAAEV